MWNTFSVTWTREAAASVLLKWGLLKEGTPLGIYGLFKVFWGLGFGVEGRIAFRVYGLGVSIILTNCLGFRVQGPEFSRGENCSLRRGVIR